MISVASFFFLGFMLVVTFGVFFQGVSSVFFANAGFTAIFLEELELSSCDEF
ncbi:hypothetical protein WAF17_20795 [Bernardetia sp. ABR2-2B]|uniref:hypothetical protein n=1 Tax=Bernardetia sp. ABR2-2B TaxID=3127472 RepID=UPI0030D3A7C1